MITEAQSGRDTTDDEPLGVTPGGAADIADDYLTVTMLSAGLTDIVCRRDRVVAGERNEAGLLPAAWRVAFSRIWWKCTTQGVRPLRTDLELLALCSRPLITWPVEFNLSDTDLQRSLLTGDELSSFAEEGARLSGIDVEAEWVENRVYEALRTAALANGADSNAVDAVYASLRRFLINHVVASDHEIRALERQFPQRDSSGQTYARHVVDAAYTVRPAVGHQTLMVCPGCGNEVNGASFKCSTSGCSGGAPKKLVVNCLAAIFEQHRGTKLFIHDPGLVESRIMDRLNVPQLRQRIAVIPYPSLDTLDLLITFLDVAGNVVETWGVDAKDQVSARLLGRWFKWPSQICCQRRFLALPRHRAAEPGYIKDLEVELEGRAPGVVVISEDALIAQVKARHWAGASNERDFVLEFGARGALARSRFPARRHATRAFLLSRTGPVFPQ